MKRPIVVFLLLVMAISTQANAGELAFPDWAAVFNPDGTVKDLTGGIEAVYIQDNISSGVATDMSALDNARYSIYNGTVPSAHDIGNVYAYTMRDALGNLVITAAAERLNSKANTYIAFEFNQGVVGVTSGAPWPIVGGRTINDLQVRLNFTGGNIATVEAMRWDGSAFVTVESGPAPAQTGCFVVSPSCDFCNGSPVAGLPPTNSTVWNSNYQIVAVPPADGFVQVSVSAGSLLGPDVEFTSMAVRTPGDIVLGSFLAMGYWSTFHGALAGQ